MSNSLQLDTVLKQFVGFYSADELIQCACTLVRKFGVTGSIDVLQKIQSLLSLTSNASNFVSQLLGMVNRIESIVDDLFGMRWAEAALYGAISKIDVCPILNTAIFNMIGNLDIAKSLSVSQWFKNRADVIIGYSNQTHQELQKALQILGAISQIALLMKDCSVELTGGGVKLMSNSVNNNASGPIIDPVYSRPTVLLYDERLYLAKVSFNNFYTASELNGIITFYNIQENIVVPANYTFAGYYPKIFFDGLQLSIYYTDSNNEPKYRRWLPGNVPNIEKQISISQKVKDICDASSIFNHLFWLKYNVDTTWSLYTKNMNTEVETEIVNVGTGRYGGIFAFGSPESNWFILYSLNNIIYLLKLSSDCIVKSNIQASLGQYPKMFLAQDLESYLLLKNNNGVTEASFTDLETFTVSFPVLRMNVLKDFYNLVGTTITLQEWIDEQNFLIGHISGYIGGYLSNPFNSF